MAQKKINCITSRVLRFTVTGALVVAPLGACGASSSETPTTSAPSIELSNPGPGHHLGTPPSDEQPETIEPETIEPEPPEDPNDPVTNTGPSVIRTNSGPSN